MAYTSAFEQNDYQTFNTRPAELPLNDMFKAVLAKNEYWNQGASKIKNTYDSALGMDLTVDANKEVKNNYLLQAQDKIKQLSSMDMGDYDVQKQGLDLFTPLLQDKSIQYDNAITKQLHSIYQDAESYKDRSINGKKGEEGDGYSVKNLAYALQGFANFNSKLSRDPKTLETLWNTNKNATYIPYHNNFKEAKVIAESCTGSSTDLQKPNGMYLQDVQKSGASPAELRACLQTNLSDAAWQQIKIDSWAQFNQDPHVLAQHIINNEKAKVEDYNNSIVSYKAKEDALKGVIKRTPAQDQQLNDAVQFGQYYKTQKQNLADIVQKYNQGDVSYFKKNYDQISFDVGKEQYLNNVSLALRTDKTVDKFTGNPVAINNNNWINKFQLENIKNQNAIKLEQLKGNGKGDSDYTTEIDPKTGQERIVLKPVHALTPGLNDGAIENSKNYQNFQQTNNGLVNSLETSLKDLQGEIQRATNGDLGPSSSSLTVEGKGGYYPFTNNKLIDYNGDGVIDQKDISDWKDNYIKTINQYTGGDKSKLKFAQKTALDLIDKWGTNNASTITTLYTNLANAANNEKSIPLEIKNATAAAIAIKDIAYVNEASINSLDIVNAIEGKSDKIKLNYSNNNNYNNSIDPLNQSSGNGQVNKVLTGFTVKTKEGDKFINVYSPYYNNIENIYNKVNKVEKERVESLNKRRNDLYGAMNLDTNQMIGAGTWTQSEKAFEDNINTGLGEDGKVKVVLHGYDAIHGGKATFELKKKSNIKTDLDGVSDGWETIDINDGKELSNKMKERLNEIFSNDITDTKGMYNFNNYIVAKNSPVIDDHLAKYNDDRVKNLERAVTTSINYQENIVKLNKIKIVDNTSIFGEMPSPIHFLVQGLDGKEKPGVRTIDIYNKASGGYIYQVMLGNTSYAKQLPEYEFDDKRKLISYLTDVGAK